VADVEYSRHENIVTIGDMIMIGCYPENADEEEDST